jgi:preprotein translocase subunit YajC
MTNNNPTPQTSTTTQTGTALQASGYGSALGSFAPMILIFVAFYFLLIRPQQKRDAKRREMINAAKRDDRVVTAGGVIGRVHKVISDNEVSLEISDGVRVRVLKTAISDVLASNSALGKDDDDNAAATADRQGGKKATEGIKRKNKG